MWRQGFAASNHRMLSYVTFFLNFVFSPYLEIANSSQMVYGGARYKSLFYMGQLLQCLAAKWPRYSLRGTTLLQGMDTGLHSLIAITRFNQLPAEPEQLAHQLAEPGKPFSDTQLLSAAKALTLWVKRISHSLNQIKTDTLAAPLPKRRMNTDSFSSGLLKAPLPLAGRRHASISEFKFLSDNLPTRVSRCYGTND